MLQLEFHYINVLAKEVEVECAHAQESKASKTPECNCSSVERLNPGAHDRYSLEAFLECSSASAAQGGDMQGPNDVLRGIKIGEKNTWHVKVLTHAKISGEGEGHFHAGLFVHHGEDRGDALHIGKPNGKSEDQC